MPSNSKHLFAAGAGWLLLGLGSAAQAQSITASAPRAPARIADDGGYDAVGYAAMREGAVPVAGITAAHISLPLESHAEVTALTTGRTIVVRVDDRAAAGGPLVLLSPDAAAQLGVAGNAPVRIRRVKPSAQEEAVLRAGGRAPARLDAPPALLAALRKRLPEAMTAQKALRPDGARPSESRSAPPRTTSVPTGAVPRSPTFPPAVKSGRYIVQIAALSTEAGALALARKLDGHVASGGRFWRVRLGPYASQTEAQAAVRRLAGKGFENVRIMVIDAQ